MKYQNGGALKSMQTSLITRNISGSREYTGCDRQRNENEAVASDHYSG